MKRIVFSILGGMFFPILYTVVVVLIIELFFPQYNLNTMQVAGEPTMGLVFAPVAIPFWTYNYIQYFNFFGLRMFLDTILFRTILFLGFNFILYTALTYLVLRYFGLFNPAKEVNYTDPPLPPQF